MPTNTLPRIFITGGSGFIGARLAQVARELGYAVTVTAAVRNAAEKARCDILAKSGIGVLVAPLEDSAALTRALPGHDAVIHLAAAQHEAEQPESYFEQINVTGTRRLLDLAAQAGIRRFVHGSTIGVYGSAAAGELDEDSALAPDNPYGRTKAAAEGVVRESAGKLEFCIIRISETYGPGDMRLLKLFKGIARGRYLTIGKGTNLHQLIYVDDLSRGLLAAVSSEAARGATIILAGAEQISTNQMASLVASAVDRSGRLHNVPLWPFTAAAGLFETICPPLGLKPPLHRRRLDFFRKSFRFSTARARNLLGFAPQVTFSDGARRTAAWYRANGYL